MKSENKYIEDFLEDESNDLSLLTESFVRYEKIKSFKELIVWQKSMELVKEIYLLSKKFPEEERFGLSSQVRRAVTSVPSNIAEGWGRNSKGSYLNYLRISHGSLCEVVTQITISEMLGYLKKEETEEVKNLMEECSKMLNSMINKIEKSNFIK